LESFINQQIPEGYVFYKKMKNKTESYDKNQIQRHLSFNVKVKEVLPNVTGKNFYTKSSPQNQQLDNLKLFRDSVVHTKLEDDVFGYRELMKKSLKFDYDKALETVSVFMNFYKPNYIEECNCGLDF
tara:strand:- start:11849 stop:12229 length:381 start_codon:yes stop_codon:yes gene_type:complete